MPWNNIQDRALGGVRSRENINDQMYPDPPTTAAILSQRRRDREQRQIDAARAKAEQLQAERAKLREAAAATHAEQEEAAYKEQMRVRYVAAGGTEASFYQLFPQMWREELLRRTAGQDEATRSARAAKYAF